MIYYTIGHTTKVGKDTNIQLENYSFLLVLSVLNKTPSDKDERITVTHTGCETRL